MEPKVRALVLVLILAAVQAAAQDKPDALKLYLEEKYEEARLACLNEISSRPDDIEPYVVLSWSLISLGRWADAQNYANKGLAIRRDPRLVEALGEAAYFLGRNEEALRRFQEYVASVPEGGRVGAAYYYMGEIYIRLAKYSYADIALSTAVQFLPGSSRWWARLGWAREKAADYPNASAAYKKALEINPRLQEALDGLERCAAKMR
jgi:tetratricopeptide (TPR) repeat protein